MPDKPRWLGDGLRSRAFDFLVHFAARGLALPSGLRESGSRAYLYADTLMDLEHDLAFGLVNVPSEDLDTYAIDPTAPDTTTLHRWIADRAPEVERQFDIAYALLRELPRVTGIWGKMLLDAKRKKFQRFLAEAGLL